MVRPLTKGWASAFALDLLTTAPLEHVDTRGRMRSTAQCWCTDMDGVLVREEHALPGAA